MNVNGAKKEMNPGKCQKFPLDPKRLAFIALKKEQGRGSGEMANLVRGKGMECKFMNQGEYVSRYATREKKSIERS
jgi:hypothetical protein